MICNFDSIIYSKYELKRDGTELWLSEWMNNQCHHSNNYVDIKCINISCTLYHTPLTD